MNLRTAHRARLFSAFTVATGIFAPVLVIAAPPSPASSPMQLREAPQEVRQHVSVEAACEEAARSGALVLVVFVPVRDEAADAWFRRWRDDQQFLKNARPLEMVRIDPTAQPDVARRFRVTRSSELVLMTAEMKLVARAEHALTLGDARAVVSWIDEGRMRAWRGQWLGTVTEGEVAELKRMPAEQREAKLLAMLGDADPAVREQARQVVMELREVAMPVLLAAVEDEYLGTRLAAAECLAALSPDVPPFDAWAPAEARQQQAQALRDWWASAGKLPEPRSDEAFAAMQGRTVTAALEALRSDDPVRRTGAMSVLRREGEAALPAIREAAAKAAREGDQKTLWLLDDVRWAVLVPEAMEAKAEARRALARGTSGERQAAAERLGKGGGEAIPALRELVADPDALVREAAVRALGGIGGSDAIAAMAAVLASPDPSLRTVAAERLGATKDRAAGPHLATVLRDPEEIVATTAIAAMSEIGTDQIDPLIDCLDDPRWRIRAAAAKTLGELKAIQARPRMEALLNDSDPFVVRSAMDALSKMGGTPSRQMLMRVMERVPETRSVSIEFLLRSDDPEALEAVGAAYDAADTKGRVEILGAMLGGRGRTRTNDAHWGPLLKRIADDPSPEVRRQVPAVLQRGTPATAAEVVDTLLSGTDPETRRRTAETVIWIAAHHWGVGETQSMPGFGVLAMQESGQGASGSAGSPAIEGHMVIQARAEAAINGVSPYRSTTALPDAAATSEDAAHIAEMHRRWHKYLAAELNTGATAAETRLAYYVTGDPVAALPRLMSAMEVEAERASLLQSIAHLGAAPLLLKRLPWPEGRPIIERMMDSPASYAALLASLRSLDGEVGELVGDPERLVRAIEAADQAAFETLAEALLGGRSLVGAVLMQSHARGDAMIDRLLASPDGRARTVGIFALGQRATAEDARLHAALADADPWARRAALQALARRMPQGEAFEAFIEPLLSDADPRVVRAAVESLLLPGLRNEMGVSEPGRQFEHGSVTVWRSDSYSSDDAPPIKPVTRRPALLGRLGALLDAPPGGDDEIGPIVAVVLAQYGDAAGLEKVLTEWQQGGGDPPAALLAALPLTRDPRYLPAIRFRVERAGDEYELRELLGWLRGVPGDEVRELRKQINLRMRKLQ